MRGRGSRAVLVAVVLAVVAPPARAALPPTSLSATNYLTFADRLQLALNPEWDAKAGAYRTGNSLTTRVNAALLFTHANAALAGWTGPTRQDARARSLVSWLTRAPAFRRLGVHGPGWTSRLDRAGTPEHFSLDPKVAEALAAAYAARGRIGLSGRLQALIRNRIALVARSRFYLARHVNQVNWNADLYLADEVVNGRAVARSRYRHWLTWYLDHARRKITRGTTNLNAGYGFHYRPDRPGAKENRNSTSEYASMVLGVVLPYDHARAEGMPAVTAAEGEVARRWQRRVLYGDWTRAGYLNWDTGHGYLRWQLRRYWALAANGLLAVATSRRLAFGPSARGQAKYVFDQSLRLYERFAATEGTLLKPTSFEVRNDAAEPRLDPSLTAARFASLATRAAVLGMGSLRAVPLPPAYAYDPDIRRLAVTTPAYSTAITPISDVGNGGLELSRLVDGRGIPLSGSGGNGTTSTGFGLRLINHSSVVLDTQPGFAAFAPPVVGRLHASLPAGGNAFARLTSTSHVRRGNRRVNVVHDFTPTTIRVRHTVIGARGLGAQLRFPAYRTASFELTRASQIVIVRLETGPVSAAGARRLRVRLADGRDYVATFDAPLPAGSTLRVVTPANARSAPTTDRTAIVSVPLRAGVVTIGYTLTP
jgi:hypothetical protein